MLLTKTEIIEHVTVPMLQSKLRELYDAKDPTIALVLEIERPTLDKASADLAKLQLIML